MSLEKRFKIATLDSSLNKCICTDLRKATPRFTAQKAHTFTNFPEHIDLHKVNDIIVIDWQGLFP